jgi:phosphatidylserine/phosphatidylglycerophosphate/cardiolipin synthase-like enzyme
MKISLKLFYILFIQHLCLNGIQPRVYFKGTDIQAKLIGLIQNEKECIKVAMYAFTDKEVAKKLVAAHKRGVRVECIVDSLTINNQSQIASYLRSQGIPVKEYTAPFFGSSMHLKCWQFKSTKSDGRHGYGPHVMTGSYNCTYNGTYRNVENAIILFGKHIFEEYDDFFKEIKQKSTYISKE